LGETPIRKGKEKRAIFWKKKMTRIHPQNEQRGRKQHEKRGPHHNPCRKTGKRTARQARLNFNAPRGADLSPSMERHRREEEGMEGTDMSVTGK